MKTVAADIALRHAVDLRSVAQISCYASGTDQEVTLVDCRERLVEYLNANSVAYEILPHRQAFTMPEVAAALHISGKLVAKSVVVKVGDSVALLVVPSPDRIDLAKAGSLIGATRVRLATEDEFADLFPDCAVGAMPPFGNLYDVPTYVDEALSREASIVFRVGTHRHTMRVSYADFARLARPTVGDLALGP